MKIYIRIILLIIVAIMINKCASTRNTRERILQSSIIRFTITKTDSISFQSLNSQWEKLAEIDKNSFKNLEEFKVGNPFSPGNLFRWILINPDTVKISVLNENGSIIGKEYSVYLNAGIYEMTFNDESLLKVGMYYIMKIKNSEGAFYIKFVMF
jgi:hypothetical protein